MGLASLPYPAQSASRSSSSCPVAALRARFGRVGRSIVQVFGPQRLRKAQAAFALIGQRVHLALVHRLTLAPLGPILNAPPAEPEIHAFAARAFGRFEL